jgi:hypothetical protein
MWITSFSYLPTWASTSEPKAPCRIQIHNPHISTYFSNKVGKAYVKIDAESVCNIPQSQVKLTVELYKRGKFGGQLVSSTTTDPKNPKSSGLLVKNYNTFTPCIDTKSTTYYGLAYASAVVSGKPVYAGKTFTQGFSKIACGTP